MKKIGIIGIGNPLRGDDEVGILLLKRLQKQRKKLPKHIEFIDGGTGGMTLLHILARFQTVMIIDAVDFQGKPGESRVFTLEEIQSKKTPVTLSTHESDFLNVIRLSQELKELPRIVVIFGVQPKDVSFGTGLSREIEMVFDDVSIALQQQIHKLLL